MRAVTLDVVIPSARPDVEGLLVILATPIPDSMQVHFYLVIDLPGALTLEAETRLRSGNSNLTIIRNGMNLGAHISRNIGFDAGASEYVLFLDDDIEPDPELFKAYAKAILEHPPTPGFVGVTRFPQPINSFTRGVVASDILTVFGFAETHRTMAWGVTSNLMVRRKAVDGVRFSSDFPKSGGGEDVDFCLQVMKKTGSRFISVPGALVRHPWWGNGSHQYERFARWAYGDCRLPELHGSYKYRNAPNLVETLLLGGLLGTALMPLRVVTLAQLAGWIGLVVLSEFAFEIIHLYLGKNEGPLVAVEATLVRISNDLGRVTGNIRHGHLLGFTERFDFFVTGESIFRERKVASLKFLLFSVATLVVGFL